jgi:hypothetical protein
VTKPAPPAPAKPAPAKPKTVVTTPPIKVPPLPAPEVKAPVVDAPPVPKLDPIKPANDLIEQTKDAIKGASENKLPSVDEAIEVPKLNLKTEVPAASQIDL